MPAQSQQYVYYQTMPTTYEVAPSPMTYEYVQYASPPPPTTSYELIQMPPPPPPTTTTYELIQMPPPPPTTTIIEVQNNQDLDFLKFNLAQANLEVRTWKKQARKLEDLLAQVKILNTSI